MDFPFEEIMQDALALQPEALSCQRFPGPRMLIGREIQVSDEPSIEGPRAGLDEAQSMVGRIDVAMVEADGLPVVVEAKLRRNRDMAGVIDQALGYARALIASPAEALLRWRAAFGRTAARDPGSPGVFRAVRSINPAWGPDDMLAAMAAHLAAGRCRVVIAADALPEAVVRDAAARRGGARRHRSRPG